MIDKNGNLRCDECGKKFGEDFEGKITIVCPRCKHYHKFVRLDKKVKVC